MRPTNNIGFLIQHLAFILARQTDQVLQERLGIGFSQFKLLMVLKWNPNIQQRVIAEQLGQTEASISRQIKLMLEQGLLRSTKSPQNRREHITELTVKGLKFTDEALLILNDYHAPVFASLSEKQQAQLLELLGAMHDAACMRSGSMCRHPLDSTN